MEMNKEWRPQPPKLPGYAQQNINPDRGKQNTVDTGEGLRAELEQQKNFVGMKFLGNPSSNFASPFDAFYTRAGSLPSYLMTLPYFSMGPNGAFTVSNNTGTGGSGIFSVSGTTLSWTTCVATYNGVQYPIDAGSTTLQFVYWQLSNPNVFQAHALGGLVVGIDDFIVAEIPGSGLWNQAINIVRSDGARWVFIGDSMFLLSAAGTLLMDLDIGGSGQGLIEIRNHLGAVTLRLDGETGIITSNGTAITVP